MRYGTRLMRVGGTHRANLNGESQLKRMEDGGVSIIFEGQREVKCSKTNRRPLILVKANKNQEVSWCLIGEAKRANPKDIWEALRIFIDAIDKDEWDPNEEGFDYDAPEGMKSYKEGSVAYVGIDRGEGFYAIGVDEKNAFYRTDPKIPLGVLRSLLYPMKELCGWDEVM